MMPSTNASRRLSQVALDFGRGGARGRSASPRRVGALAVQAQGEEHEQHAERDVDRGARSQVVGAGRAEFDEGIQDQRAHGVGDEAGGEHEGEHARADLGAAAERDHGGDGRRVDRGGQRQDEGLGGMSRGACEAVRRRARVPAVTRSDTSSRAPGRWERRRSRRARGDGGRMRSKRACERASL